MNALSNQHRLQQSIRPRRGMTLVELLVVIGIMLTLAAVAIPTVRFLTRDREIREATRMLNTFVDSARNDALENGRAGIWIERDSQFPNRSVQVFKAKFPADYRGDTYDAVALVEDHGSSGFFAYFTIDQNSLFMMDAIQVGDEIRFSNRGLWFVIRNINKGVTTTQRGTMIPPSIEVNLYENLIPLAAGGFTNSGTVRIPEGTLSPYQIRRHPTKDSLRFVELPQGTFIDLSQSGFIGTNSTATGGAIGSGCEFRSDTASGLPAKTQRVCLTFTSDGSLTTAHYEYYAGGGLYQTDGLLPANGPRPSRPVGTAYLLIAVDTQNDQTQALDTLGNLSNRWLSIARSKGKVTTAEPSLPGTGTDFQRRNASRIIASSGITEGGG